MDPKQPHRAEPVPLNPDIPKGAIVCRICGQAVRQWPDGRFPIHARATL